MMIAIPLSLILAIVNLAILRKNSIWISLWLEIYLFIPVIVITIDIMQVSFITYSADIIASSIISIICLFLTTIPFIVKVFALEYEATWWEAYDDMKNSSEEEREAWQKIYNEIFGDIAREDDTLEK